MRCPFCGISDTKVIESRLTEDSSAIRRRRECKRCRKRFTTYERHEQQPMVVVKKDGRRELFDRSKIISGILKACEKRPVSLEQIENLASSVEHKLRSQYSGELPSRQIGELIIEELKAIDPVAYIRFASVYKEFKDVDMFTEEVKSLKGR